jgi:hypothetical protein
VNDHICQQENKYGSQVPILSERYLFSIWSCDPVFLNQDYLMSDFALKQKKSSKEFMENEPVYRNPIKSQ